MFAAPPAATPGVPDAPPQPSMAPPQPAAAMDGAERAFEVGSQIATTLSTPSGSPTGAESSHVNAVADQLINMFNVETGRRRGTLHNLG